MDMDLSKPLPDEVVFILQAKAYEFQKDGVEKIVAAEIEDYLRNVVWRNKIAITFCDMIDDIMSLQFSTIFEYLQAKVIKEAETKNLADFQNLIMK